jgi:hypothetical protein
MKQDFEVDKSLELEKEFIQFQDMQKKHQMTKLQNYIEEVQNQYLTDLLTLLKHFLQNSLQK